MAKRNKPGQPKGKRKGYGTRQIGRDWDRGEGLWSIAVPTGYAQGARTFSMEGAIPAGERKGDPYWKHLWLEGGLLRWRLDRNGESFFLYGRTNDFPDWRNPGCYDGPLPGIGETYEVYQARRKCTRDDSCPLTRYWETDVDFTLKSHRPGTCPMGVPGPGVWKHTKRIKVIGKG
jgi:hypothetical protein